MRSKSYNDSRYKIYDMNQNNIPLKCKKIGCINSSINTITEPPSSYLNKDSKEVPKAYHVLNVFLYTKYTPTYIDNCHEKIVFKRILCE